MFKHILVTTDGSERADKGITAALALAKSCGARVTALMVVPDYSTQQFAEVVFRDGPAFDALRSSLAEAGRSSLDKTLARHGTASRGVECCVVIADSTSATILHHARSEGCDLIVMASHGRGAVASALLGSQTLSVISGAQVPVLVVK